MQPVATRSRPVRTARAPRIDHEGVEQMALIRWLYGEQQRGEAVGAFYEVIYHVPNGGQRNKKTAADLKRQGVKSGVSDLVVMEGRGGWLGLYVEFKATPPKHAATQPSQREWLEKADHRGYCAVLARGLEEAKAVLREYASWAPTLIEQRETMAYGTEW